MARMNIRISGLGGQGAVTAAHLLAMAANRDGKFSISNPFFGAEKRMAPAESYCRVGTERIYDRGELVFPDVIMVFHAQVITMQKSYTAPFYSGIKENGLVIINTPADLLNDEDRKTLGDLNVKVFNHDATKLALDIGKTELSTNMAMIGACAGVTKIVSLNLWMARFKNALERSSLLLVVPPHWMKPLRRNIRKRMIFSRLIWIVLPNLIAWPMLGQRSRMTYS